MKEFLKKVNAFCGDYTLAVSLNTLGGGFKLLFAQTRQERVEHLSSEDRLYDTIMWMNLAVKMVGYYGYHEKSQYWRLLELDR